MHKYIYICIYIYIIHIYILFLFPMIYDESPHVREVIENIPCKRSKRNRKERKRERRGENKKARKPNKKRTAKRSGEAEAKQEGNNRTKQNTACSVVTHGLQRRQTSGWVVLERGGWPEKPEVGLEEGVGRRSPGMLRGACGRRCRRR